MRLVETWVVVVVVEDVVGYVVGSSVRDVRLGVVCPNCMGAGTS